MMFDVRLIETQFYQQSSSDSVFSPNMGTPKMVRNCCRCSFLTFFHGKFPPWELTCPLNKGTFESMMVPFPLWWDMLC